MRSVHLALAALFVATIAGCSSGDDGTSNTAESPDTEVRVGAKKSVSGLKLGKYADASAGEGEFTQLELESRTSRTPRQYDGLYSGKRKVGGVAKAVKGGFQVLRKRIPMSSQASGFLTTNIVRLFDDAGGVLHEASFSYVQNTLVLYDWKKETEQLIDLVKDASGNSPFSLSCSLKTLHDDNVFEEGLSIDEYPDISLEEVDGKLDIGIGAASFDQADGDRITILSRSGSNIDAKIDMGDGYSYRITVKDKKGVISATENGAENPVADFTCR